MRAGAVFEEEAGCGSGAGDTAAADGSDSAQASATDSRRRGGGRATSLSRTTRNVVAAAAAAIVVVSSQPMHTTITVPGAQTLPPTLVDTTVVLAVANCSGGGECRSGGAR